MPGSRSVRFPTKECPYQYLGCSLAGFTSFHSSGFPPDYVTVALSRLQYHIPNDLGIFPAVNPKRITLTYEFVKHEHYKHLSLCEHGLSSTHLRCAAITQTSTHCLSIVLSSSFLVNATMLSITYSLMDRIGNDSQEIRSQHLQISFRKQLFLNWRPFSRCHN